MGSSKAERDGEGASRGRRRRSALAVLVALPAALAGSSARSDPSPAYAIAWSAKPGAETCGDAESLARAVEARLKRRAFEAPARAEVTVDVKVERASNPPRWRALVTLRSRAGALGVRRLENEARECAPLRDSLALAIALMIDPDAALSSATSPPPPAPSAAAVPAPPSGSARAPNAPPTAAIARPAPTTPPPDVRRGRIELEGGARVSNGLLPGVALGAAVGASFGLTRTWALGTYVAAYLPETVSAPRGTAGVFSLVSAGVTACGTAWGGPGRVSLALCAGAEAGILRARGEAFYAVAASAVPTVDLTAGAQLRAPLGWGLSARLGGVVSVPLVRDDFTYTDASGAFQSLYRRPPVAETGEIGVAVDLR